MYIDIQIYIYIYIYICMYMYILYIGSLFNESALKKCYGIKTQRPNAKGGDDVYIYQYILKYI